MDGGQLPRIMQGVSAIRSVKHFTNHDYDCFKSVLFADQITLLLRTKMCVYTSLFLQMFGGELEKRDTDSDV